MAFPEIQSSLQLSSTRSLTVQSAVCSMTKHKR
uniref:Uncharacterized protein n=1 Tax=Anguilla anguilla TaxID=7936 RepID=A0A0E9PNF3_ANGAN